MLINAFTNNYIYVYIYIGTRIVEINLFLYEKKNNNVQTFRNFDGLGACYCHLLYDLLL